MRYALSATVTCTNLDLIADYEDIKHFTAIGTCIAVFAGGIPNDAEYHVHAIVWHMGLT